MIDSAHRAALDAAYRRTDYRGTVAGQPVVARVGARCPPLDAIAGAGWAWITAANPGSRPLTAEENAIRMGGLALRLQESGYRSWPAESAADDGGWPVEPGLFVVGLSRESARSLAVEFGQNAILWSDGVNPAQLEWLTGA